MLQVEYVNNGAIKKIIFFFCILYLILPVVAIVFLFGMLFYQSRAKIDTRYLFLFFGMLALYMGLINVTKVPYSDQVQYMNAYLLVPKQSIWQSLTNIYGERTMTSGSTKEMGYGLLNIIGYVTSFGSYPLFVIEFICLLYWLYFMAIKRFFEIVSPAYSVSCILAASMILCFFSQFFNLTIHLQRQEIATAVMIYAIVDYSVTDKYHLKQFLIPLFSVTLHTSVGLFLPLFFVKQFFKGIVKRKQVLVVISVVLILLVLSTVLAASLLSSLGGQEIYALDRMAVAGSSEEDTFDISFILIFNIPLIFISLKNIWYPSLFGEETKENVFYLFYLIVSSFTLLTPDATMRYRYFMMSYAFWPFLLPLLIKKKNSLLKPYLLVVVAFLFFRFFATFEAMPWKYASLEDVLTDNVVFLYLCNPF